MFDPQPHGKYGETPADCQVGERDEFMAASLARAVRRGKRRLVAARHAAGVVWGLPPPPPGQARKAVPADDQYLI